MEKVYICGFATDYCAKLTVLDAVDAGFTVHLFPEICRVVNVKPGDVEKTLVDMQEKGAILKTCDEIMKRKSNL